MGKIKWVTLDTMDGERSLKQHAFKHRDAKVPWTAEPYEGNVSLCGNVHASSPYNEELQEAFSKLNGESVDTSNICKSCLRLSGHACTECDCYVLRPGKCLTCSII